MTIATTFHCANKMRLDDGYQVQINVRITSLFGAVIHHVVFRLAYFERHSDLFDAGGFLVFG